MAAGGYTWLMYFSVFIGSPIAIVIPTAKSIISKLVAADEIGKVFSLLSIGEVTAVIVGTGVLTALYTATLEIYAGLTLAIEAVLMVLLVFAVSLLDLYVRRTKLNDSSSYIPLDERSDNINDIEMTSRDAAQLTNVEPLSSYGTMDQSVSDTGEKYEGMRNEKQVEAEPTEDTDYVSRR